MLPTLKHSKIDELDALTITSPDYTATVLLQGAQLIHFSTRTEPDNWLWVSDKAEYKVGDSVRGGVLLQPQTMMPYVVAILVILKLLKLNLMTQSFR